MKKFLCCLTAIFIMISVCLVPSSAASPSLSVVTSAYQVNHGDIITVTVSVSSGSNLGSLDFNVNYKTSELQYVTGSMSATSLFNMAEVNDLTAGSLKYVGISTGTVTDGGALVSMKFKAIKPVNEGSLISISVTKATDGDDKNVSVSKTSVSITCAHGDIVWTPSKYATCTQTGTERGICSCGFEDYRTVPKTEHKFSDPVIKKKPTCTENGLMQGTCDECGEVGAESVIPATGHTYGDWVVTLPATAVTTGLQERNCRVCGYLETQVIPMGSEGESSTEPSTDMTLPTEPSTQYEPIVTTTNPPLDFSDIEIETTEPSGGLFGNSDFSESDRAALIVIVLAIFVVIVLVVYILLLRQRKK